MSNRATRIVWCLLALLSAGCAADGSNQPRSCDAECQDQAAVRSIRETLKLIYNLRLQSNPVGAQDELTLCPLGGGAHVFGEASSLADQGATRVDLTYQLGECGYLQKDDDPGQSYDVVITGEIRQSGIIAVQPTATTALLFEADTVSVTGTVFDPALDYSAEDCTLRLSQNGNRLAGTFCERDVGLDL